jgi:S-formylglutathione hydrolase FrmB
VTTGACSSAQPVPGPPAVPPPSFPTPLSQPVTVQKVSSAARGKDVELVLVTPEGVAAAGLPVVLALHGRGANARVWLDLGLPAALTQAVRSGVPPFAVAAVDGDHYWVQTDSADDPQRMLTEELPGWLTRSGLRPAPSAALGISMGGFGALRYARDHRDLKTVATASAALFVSWGDAKARKVFRDEAQWRSHEPLLHTADLRGTPTAVWCGTEDPFAGAARKYIQAAHPDPASLTPGAHTDEYWKRVLPEILTYTGTHATA